MAVTAITMAGITATAIITVGITAIITVGGINAVTPNVAGFQRMRRVVSGTIVAGVREELPARRHTARVPQT